MTFSTRPGALSCSRRTSSPHPEPRIPRFSPAAVLAAVAEHRVTDVMLVPTMLQLVLADPALAGYDLSSLQRIFYGAAPMTEPLLRAAMRALPGMGFVQGYGLTSSPA